MITYCAKHFTYMISHKRGGKSYFILHPQSPQAVKRTQPAPTPTPGPQPALLSCPHMTPRAPLQAPRQKLKVRQH